MANQHVTRLQRLCAFVNASRDILELLYERLVSEFGLGREANDLEAVYIARNLRATLIYIIGVLPYKKNTVALYNAIDAGGYQIHTLQGIIEPHRHIKAFLPDVINAPPGALKVCAWGRCGNPFVSTIKTARYCSINCRANANNRRIRDKNK